MYLLRMIMFHQIMAKKIMPFNSGTVHENSLIYSTALDFLFCKSNFHAEERKSEKLCLILLEMDSQNVSIKFCNSAEKLLHTTSLFLGCLMPSNICLIDQVLECSLKMCMVISLLEYIAGSLKFGVCHLSFLSPLRIPIYWKMDMLLKMIN